MGLLEVGILGAAGGVVEGAMGVSNARANRGLQKQMARNKYQYMMKDLEKAGLNPILMAGSGMGTPGVGGASGGGTISPPNIGLAGLEGASAAKGIEKADAQKIAEWLEHNKEKLATMESQEILKTLREVLKE